MWSKEAAVAHHTVRLDDQLGDYELIEYDEHDAVVTRTAMRHPRGGEPGELIRFDSHGAEILRKTYTDPVGHPSRARVIAGPHAGQSGKLGVTIRNEHTGEIKQRVDIAVDAKRMKSIFVDPADVEQLD